MTRDEAWRAIHTANSARVAEDQNIVSGFKKCAALFQQQIISQNEFMAYYALYNDAQNRINLAVRRAEAIELAWDNGDDPLLWKLSNEA